jgi:predicted phage terminase large subunit-like protein
MAMSRKQLETVLKLKREKRIRAARASLWEYCKLESPDFYTDSKWHLHLFCWVLQSLYEGKLNRDNFITAAKEICPKWFIELYNFEDIPEKERFTKLMVNLPPRLGKSRTLVNYCKWVFGQEITNKIITCSYNDDMAQDFSRYTRDGIDEEKTFPHEIIFSDIFPNAKIKHGNASYGQWALEGNFFNYKGAGVGGSITGKGCNISIVDDPVKDAEEAFNDNRLDKIWLWYTGTFLSRLEQGGVEIVNMTRWAKGDICGRILDDPIEAQEWFVFKLEAAYEQVNEMLCPDLLGPERYATLKRNVDESIFRANYHQEPVDIKGRLYSSLKTYEKIPQDDNGNSLLEGIINYTDTADMGDDYLCSLCAGVYQGQLYILDVLYTKEPMEITEPKTAQLLVKNNVGLSKIESNNGGRGFARNVERLIWDEFKSRKVAIQWFTQTKNKKSRILTNASYVVNNVYFPLNWRERWPEFYKALTTYQKEGKNKNDDGPDTLTGLAEMMDNQPRARSL